MSIINPIHTPCKSCAFAKYDGITQTDCHIDYINKYKANNTEILEAYDNDKEFYIINNKKCVGYRENKWFEQFDLSDAAIEQKIAKFNELNKLHYLLAVNLKNFTFDQLKSLLKEIGELECPPLKIILIRYPDKDATFSYEKIVETFNEYKINIKWRIQTMVDDLLTYDEILHNIVTLNTEYRFILSVAEPCLELTKIVDQANNRVHTELRSFEIISNQEKTCIIFSGPVYRYAIKNTHNILKDYKMYEFCNLG